MNLNYFSLYGKSKLNCSAHCCSRLIFTPAPPHTISTTGPLIPSGNLFFKRSKYKIASAAPHAGSTSILWSSKHNNTLLNSAWSFNFWLTSKPDATLNGLAIGDNAADHFVFFHFVKYLWQNPHSPQSYRNTNLDIILFYHQQLFFINEINTLNFKY